MAFDDLDLEFEDEEEAAKKKKGEAVQVDHDLEFSMPDNGNSTKSRPALIKPTTPQAAAPPGNVAKPGVARPQAAPATVTKIDEARKAPAGVARPMAASPVARAQAPRTAGSSALQPEQSDFESQEIVALREQLRRTEFEADVKVAVAEYKTELLSELLSDTKLMQHQVEQLLVRINAKHPDMKQEVLMIKKILADFNAKKRK